MTNPFQRLARRILYQAAKDMTPDHGQVWLKSDTCKAMCEQAGVSHAEFTSAILYMLDKSEAPRMILLKALKKNLGA